MIPEKKTKRQPPKPKTVLFRDSQYPGHAVLQVRFNSFLIFLLYREEAGDVIAASADALIECATLPEAWAAVQQMHEYNESQRKRLINPAEQPIQLASVNGGKLHA